MSFSFPKFYKRFHIHYIGSFPEKHGIRENSYFFLPANKIPLAVTAKGTSVRVQFFAALVLQPEEIVGGNLKYSAKRGQVLRVGNALARFPQGYAVLRHAQPFRQLRLRQVFLLPQFLDPFTHSFHTKILLQFVVFLLTNDG